MHNGTGKTSVSFIYPMKNLNEPFLPYESLLDNTILLISTLSVLIGLLFLWNAFFNIDQKSNLFVPFLYHIKKLRWKMFTLSFLLYNNFFDIILVFYFLQTYFDIYLFHIFFFHFLFCQIILYIYFLLAVAIFLCYFHSILLLELIVSLNFFDNK